MILRVAGFDFASGPIPGNGQHCTYRCWILSYSRSLHPRDERSSHLEFGWSRPHGANRRWHIRGSKPRIRARNSPIPRADFTYTNTQVSVWSTPASEGFEKRFKLFWSHLKRLSGGRHFSLALLLLKYLRRVETKSRTPVPARPPSGRGTARRAIKQSCIQLNRYF